jgi:SH3-like domain-containing protein
MRLGRTAILALLGAALALAQPAAAETKVDAHALPRFASLKRELTNARVGPGLDYPIRWRYERAGVPVEVVASYGAWRQIRDSHGQGGWVNAAMLRPARSALVNPWLKTDLALRIGPSTSAVVRARLQPNVLLHVRSCDLHWCFVQLPAHDLKGYVQQARLWGVYPDEVIRAPSLWAAILAII